MIKINLLGDDTAVDHSGLLLLVGYGASVCLLLGVFTYLFISTSSEVVNLTTEVELKRADLSRLQVKTKEVKEFERKKAELNNKLVVIAKLKRSKVGPVRVLDDLNLAVPERAWLTQIEERGGYLNISGFALDNLTVSRFMKELTESEFFSDVRLAESKEAKKGDVGITQFTLQALVQYTGAIIKEEQESLSDA